MKSNGNKCKIVCIVLCFYFPPVRVKRHFYMYILKGSQWAITMQRKALIVRKNTALKHQQHSSLEWKSWKICWELLRRSEECTKYCWVLEGVGKTNQLFKWLSSESLQPFCWRAGSHLPHPQSVTVEDTPDSGFMTEQFCMNCMAVPDCPGWPWTCCHSQNRCRVFTGTESLFLFHSTWVKSQKCQTDGLAHLSNCHLHTPFTHSVWLKHTASTSLPHAYLKAFSLSLLLYPWSLKCGYLLLHLTLEEICACLTCWREQVYWCYSLMKGSSSSNERRKR